MKERKPHKYAEVIKAWADGKPIQFKTASGRWYDYIYISDCTESTPRFDQFEWRVKPDDIVVENYIWLDAAHNEARLSVSSSPNVRFTFDPDTKSLIKAEIIR